MLAAGLFTRTMGAFRLIRDHYRVLQIAGGAVMVTLGLPSLFGRFWNLRVFLNRALEWLGISPCF